LGGGCLRQVLDAAIRSNLLVPSARDTLTLVLRHHPQAECRRRASESRGGKARRRCLTVRLATARVAVSLRRGHRTNTVQAVQHAPIDDAGFSIAASPADA